MKADEYISLKTRTKGLFRDRGSKFIAIASPASSADEAMLIIEEIRKEYRDARHHCYAYKIGTGEDNWRVNDDGEPSGSGGNPILGQIRSFKITNIVFWQRIPVMRGSINKTRWFRIISLSKRIYG